MRVLCAVITASGGGTVVRTVRRNRRRLAPRRGIEGVGNAPDGESAASVAKDSKFVALQILSLLRLNNFPVASIGFFREGFGRVALGGN